MSFRTHFSAADWQRLRALGAEVRFEVGAVLMRRGEPSRRVVAVESGALEVVDRRTTPPTVLAQCVAGDVLGEMSLLDDAPVSADVRVHLPAVCVDWDTEALRSALASDPALSAVFHRAVSAILAARLRGVTSSALRGGFAAGDARGPTQAPATGQPAVSHPTGTGPPPIDEAIAQARVLLSTQVHAPTAARVAAELAHLGIDPHLGSALVRQGDPGRSVQVSTERVRIGRASTCEVVLDDPRLAAVQAELVRTDAGWRLISATERAAVVDGVSVSSCPVGPQSQIDLGPYSVQIDGNTLRIEPEGPPAVLEARDLGRAVGGRTLLHRVSFAALGGEVIAVVGPSGAGKSTLLGAISGVAPPQSGVVQLDGVSLRQRLTACPTLVGEVPQDDIVLPELTVEESLRSAARLRMPADTPREQRQIAVNRVLADLGLEPIRGSRIGDPEERGISGGQRKRVNIGQELLTRDTRVLFLDEPTSGLDPKAANEIARLARRLADAGRIVLLVTHDMSDGVLAQVDHLLLMLPGGHLGWFGPPSEATAHFGVRSVAEIFARLADHSPESWARRYGDSESARRWVHMRSRVLASGLLDRAESPPQRPSPTRLGLLWELTSRYARVKLRDRTSLAVLAAQPLLVALVMELVFRRPTSAALFLLVLSWFWFGMSASVRELIADRVIWRRERRVGVSATAWVLAKVGVLGVAVALQASTLTALVYFGSHLHGLGFSASALGAAGVLTGWVGMTTGLVVSAAWRRSEAAVGTIVLLLIPQIAFAGMMMPLQETTAFARLCSWLTPVRYAFQLALRCGHRLQYVQLGEWHERPIAGELYLMGLRPGGADAEGLGVASLVFILVAIGAIELLATVKLMSRR